MLIVFVILILGLLTPRLSGRLGIPVENLAKYVFYGAIILIFGIQAYWSWQQYSLWKYAGPPASYLLPPHQPISYFYLYAYMQFFNKFVISCFASFIFLLAANILNHRFHRRFFEKEEPYFGALSIFMLGQPLWLFYLPVVLAGGLVVSAYKSYLTHKTYRFSLYYLWMGSAIVLFLALQLSVFLGFNFY